MTIDESRALALRLDGVVADVRAYYAMPGNDGGGSLHVVLEDGNNDDDGIRWCMEYAKSAGDVAGQYLAQRLLSLTLDERDQLAEMLR